MQTAELGEIEESGEMVVVLVVLSKPAGANDYIDFYVSCQRQVSLPTMPKPIRRTINFGQLNVLLISVKNTCACTLWIGRLAHLFDHWRSFV